MLGICQILGSNAAIKSGGATNIVSTTCDLRSVYYDSLNLFYKLHSTPANVSACFWVERAPVEEGPYMIAGNSFAAIASNTNYSWNLSTTNLPWLRLCAVNYSATPTITYTAYLTYQEEY